MKILKLLNSFIFFLFCCVFLFPRFFESADLQFNQFDDYLDEDFEVDTVGTVYRTSNSKTLEKSSFNDIQETVNEIEDEGDYDEEEDIVINSGVFTPPARISVMFENAYTNESVDLYWVSDKGEEVYMSEIFPTESARVDTTVSHAFLAKGKISGALMNPSLFVIQKSKLTYTFEPRQSTSFSDGTKLAPKPYVALLNRESTSCSAKFRSLVPTPIDVWYDDGKGGTFQGSLDLGKEYTVNSYIGHVFFFTAKGNKKKVFASHTVRPDKVVYVIEDKDHPAPSHMLAHLEKEERFMAEYKNRTGLQWRHYFGPNGPRGPPVLHMWPAKEIGQIHKVTSSEGYWTCLTYTDKEKCHSSEPVPLELEVISTHPKAFLIKNFLSDIEADAIRAYAEPRMDSSYVGNKDAGGARKSDTRTSRNTWVGRGAFPVTESLYHRAEQLLNISRLDARNTEDMQVVHYINGQRYDSHHDWGVSGYPESRFITLLLYLTDMVDIDAGGETAFPKAAGGKGLKVHAGKGSALLFYNLLEDGNGDDLSLHAALPVLKGEKWLANFWVWDPHRK